MHQLLYVVGSAMMVSVVALLWFKTDVVPEYGRLFKWSFTKYEDYWMLKNEDPSLTYISFLVNYHYENFFVRLITCPICFSVWLSIIACILIGVLWFPYICFLSLVFYSILVIMMSYA